MLDVYREIKNSGLTLEQIAAVLSYRSQLEEMGINMDRLGTIGEISRQYGGYEAVLEALKNYGNLLTLTDDLEKHLKRKGELEVEIKHLTEEAANLGERNRQVGDALRTYDKLRQEGFDEKVLTELKSSSDKYGGVKGVVDAINSHAMLRDLQQNISDLEREKGNLEADYKKAQADHAHLMTVIEMCDRYCTNTSSVCLQ